jgi:hypothetical protein
VRKANFVLRFQKTGFQATCFHWQNGNIRIPKSKKIASDYLSFERSFIKAKGCLKVKETLIGFCERISAKDYPVVRNEIDKIIQQQEEEVVVTLH